MGTHLTGEFGLLLPVLAAAVWLAVFCASSPAAAAQKTVVEEWATVVAPPPPELGAARADPATTALLVLDIEERTTNLKRRPRAVGSVPVIRSLLERARGAGVPVVYSTTSKGSPETILPEVAPRSGEPVVRSSVDKFYGTDLEKILRERGVQKVVIVGTAAEGAVLGTSVAAAVRGFEVIVPVDGISSSDLYAEQYVCWHLMNAPGTRGKAVLTRAALIDFAP